MNAPLNRQLTENPAITSTAFILSTQAHGRTHTVEKLQFPNLAALGSYVRKSPATDDKKASRGVVGATFKDNIRANENLLTCTGASLDFDSPIDAEHFEKVTDILESEGVGFVAHDTWSGENRFAVIVPFAQATDLAGHAAAVSRLREKLGQYGNFADESGRPGQVRFVSPNPGRLDRRVKVFEGGLLDVPAAGAAASAASTAPIPSKQSADRFGQYCDQATPEQQQLFLLALKHNLISHRLNGYLNNWFPLVYAAFRAWGINSKNLTESQREMVAALDEWSKPGEKYEPRCVEKKLTDFLRERNPPGQKQLHIHSVLAAEVDPAAMREAIENDETIDLDTKVSLNETYNVLLGGGTRESFSRVDLSPLTLDELTTARLTPRIILKNLLYADVRVRVAAGGIGKTTLALYEAVRLALGLDLWGRSPDEPKRTALFTREDQRSVLAARLREIMLAMMLTDEQKTQVLENIQIIDLSEEPFRLSVISGDVVIPNRVALDWIIHVMKSWRPDWLIFDPLVSFGVGESRVNDAEQGLVEAFRVLRNNLNACIEGIHHTGKANAREKTNDQYSSRGGTALPDGSRMVAVLNPATPEEWLKETGTPLNEGEDGIVMALPKLSYCAKQEAVFIRRKGYSFSMATRVTLSPEDLRQGDANKVFNFIAKEFNEGRRYSSKDLESMKETVGLSRDKIRAATVYLKMNGRVKYNEVQGQTGSHYEPVFMDFDDDENRDTPRHPEKDDDSIEK